jgi:hypothetical protein
MGAFMGQNKSQFERVILNILSYKKLTRRASLVCSSEMALEKNDFLVSDGQENRQIDFNRRLTQDSLMPPPTGGIKKAASFGKKGVEMMYASLASGRGLGKIIVQNNNQRHLITTELAIQANHSCTLRTP